MSISTPFINRPVATSLMTIGVALAGCMAFFLLPVSPLPQVDFPTISVQASLPGASPETMATSVATPLERHLGQIADVTEMTSQSTVGNTRVTLQFGLDRSIDGAARDVQAGINASRADLPAALKSNPTYRKMNPADSPIMIIALTSKTLLPGQLYDAASSIVSQKLSQIQGIGQVTIGGGSLPAIRVDINPLKLSKYGLSLEDVRASLAAANANSPKGFIEKGDKHYQIYTNDQISHAEDYRDLVIAWRNGSPVLLTDIASIADSVEDVRNLGLYNGSPSVVVILFKQPGANIVETIERVKASLPQIHASLPNSIDLTLAIDRSTSIRASLKDVERSLTIAVVLVILVVFLFLRSLRATIIPMIVVPLSLIGTFGIMYLFHFSLNNLSLMALTVSTGFVVDDAIVVLENITRHIEQGMPRMQAALLGTKEVGFTVLSMSLSLIAVFTPILLMGGYIGRLLFEFSATLSIAILISLLISLTTTPMICARILPEYRSRPHISRNRYHYALSLAEGAFTKIYTAYAHSLAWTLRHEAIVLLILLSTIILNIVLFVYVPKGLFPQQDIGLLGGMVQADQSISFQAMKDKMVQFLGIVKSDPAVAGINGFTGGNQTNTGNVFISLKPLRDRDVSADQVISRLRKKLSTVAGASLYLQAAQDFGRGGRPAAAQYQYTLQADNLDDLRKWTPKITESLQHSTNITDVNSDQQDKGIETELVYDRDTASRLNLKASQIDNTLYDAFGQRQVSVIYNPLNQYHVIMEVAPQYWQSEMNLNDIYISTSGGSLSGTQATSASVTAAARAISANAITAVGHNGSSTGSALSTTAETMVPLSAISHYEPGTTPLSVNHQGHFAAATISFNLPPGKFLSDAAAVIDETMRTLGVPATIHGSFQGTAQMFKQSTDNQLILIITALLTVYIVLGILYESYVHPITILSTLPSAGIGALLALMLFKNDLNIIGFIGVILLIGIVKKNAIMMIDFALAAEREDNLSSLDAITKACLLRFRPIMMTTMAALLGAIPLAIGFGEGSEIRRPLGLSVVGGLIVSQLLTLYTTPVVYLCLDRLRLWFNNERRLSLQVPS